MKLNKPTVTDTQTELENYVASLLKDNSKIAQLPRKSEQAHQTNARRSETNLSPSSKSLPNTKVTSLPDHKKAVSMTPSITAKENRQNPSSTKPVESKRSFDIQPEQKTNKQKRSSELNLKTTLQPKSNEKIVVEMLKKLDVGEQKDTPITEDSYQSQGKAASQNKVLKKAIPKKPTKSTGNNLNFGAEKEISHNQIINQEKSEYKELAFKPKQEKDPRLEGVEKLLAKIAMAKVVLPVDTQQQQSKTKTSSSQKPSAQEIQHDQQVALENAKSSFSHRENEPLKQSLGNVFQTLVFEVDKLPLAVPLVKLGGIVNVSQQDITPLVGTPDWFMGLVPHERGNLMVVDTQKFLMPEQKMSKEKEYQYLIVLDDSRWALACHTVGDAKNLSPDDIRWSSRSSKRPWFAGMVVEYMSALMEVDELINMLAETIAE